MITMSSFWLVASMLLAAVAAGWLVRGPQHRVVQATGAVPPGRLAALADRPWMARLWPRSDALPWRKRALVAAAAAVSLWLAGQSLGDPYARLSWFVAPALMIIFFVGMGRLEPARTKRHNTQLILELPQALELLAACLAAGLPLRVATAEVIKVFDGAIAVDLEPVLTNIKLGQDDAAAWRALRSHPRLGRIAVDLARSIESGTMMVEALKHHARDARRVRRAELEAQAKRVGVKSVVPLAACFIPAFLLIGIVPTVVSAFSKLFSL